MSPNREAVLSDSWQRTLSGLPSLLERLAYLASLRNPHTGAYEHFGFAQRAGAQPADQIIRSSHQAIFQEWLCFKLEQQKRELENYFFALEDREDQPEIDKREILANWLSLAPYTAWVPKETRDVERELFCSDLEIVLELIRTDYGVAARDPDA